MNKKIKFLLIAICFFKSLPSMSVSETYSVKLENAMSKKTTNVSVQKNIEIANPFGKNFPLETIFYKRNIFIKDCAISVVSLVTVGLAGIDPLKHIFNKSTERKDKKGYTVFLLSMIVPFLGVNLYDFIKNIKNYTNNSKEERLPLKENKAELIKRITLNVPSLITTLYFCQHSFRDICNEGVFYHSLYIIGSLLGLTNSLSKTFQQYQGLKSKVL